MTYERAAEAVHCPTCHAAPGQECRTVTGRPSSSHHTRRITKAGICLCPECTSLRNDTLDTPTHPEHVTPQ